MIRLLLLNFSAKSNVSVSETYEDQEGLLQFGSYPMDVNGATSCSSRTSGRLSPSFTVLFKSKLIKCSQSLIATRGAMFEKSHLVNSRCQLVKFEKGRQFFLGVS